MTSRRRMAVALSVSALLAGGGVAGAATIAPPAGTPDLASMALQPADLAPGADAGQQGYVAPPGGFTAEYAGGFTVASTSDGVSYYSIGDYISIAPTTSTVASFFNAEEAFFRSKKGHKLVDLAIIASAGKKAHLKARDIKYRVGGSLDVGGDSFLEMIGLRAKHVSVHEDVVLLSQGTVYVLLIMAANPNETIPTSDASALANAIDDHINSVLATGSTGSTGTTASTGATG